MLFTLLATLAVSAPLPAPTRTLSCAALARGTSFSAAPGVTVSLRRVGRAQLRLSTGRQSRTVPVDCFNERIQAVVGDFNFDSVPDVAVPTGVGYMGVNVFARPYFVGRDGTLRASRTEVEVANAALDPLTRTLSGGVKNGPAYNLDTHCLTPDGRDLYLCREASLSSRGEAADDYDVRWLDPSGRVLLERRFDPAGPGQRLELWQVAAQRTLFHAQPSVAARGRAYVVAGDRVEVLELRGDWVWAVYTSGTGRRTVGWLRRSDLR
ncbi:hypothetical protein [Deinococcus navajonensis]|uniref:SH3 domain-containing protein n=1 Tax=Deinococcus navajonensis TaxID=309884 RepID=A0ABV8XQK7_9DEIO